MLNDVWMLKETSLNNFCWIKLHSGSVHKQDAPIDDENYPSLRFQHSATIIEDKM